jgi:hypothetical protein
MCCLHPVPQSTCLQPVEAIRLGPRDVDERTGHLTTAMRAASALPLLRAETFPSP